MAFLNPALIDRLQAVQNCAARLVTRSRKHDHITPPASRVQPYQIQDTSVNL